MCVCESELACMAGEISKHRLWRNVGYCQQFLDPSSTKVGDVKMFYYRMPTDMCFL